MIADNAKQLRQDHGLIQARREDEAWQADRHNYGVSFKQGYRHGWWDAVEWLLNQQARWNDITEHEAILELGKGSGSVYWPLFADDQHIIVDCPTDGRVSIDKTGICDSCGFDFAR
jgi:hypothetical protein